MNSPKILKEIADENSILYIKAEQNYSVFHLEDGNKLTSAYTLKHYERHLHNNDFIRLSRSFLVQRNFVKGIRKQTSSSYAVLKNGREVLISRRRLQTVKKATF
ncbi:LytTR family DNA-binding domain-containing protein [uncultured Arcticibacterium sp.]|uniref:LytR/AlgR family response regulator transcription factor n=1 Tax=uncultured Arcticibacterium sp. TaxID=2173042 RepID=UPI0030F9A49D